MKPAGLGVVVLFLRELEDLDSADLDSDQVFLLNPGHCGAPVVTSNYYEGTVAPQ